MKIIAIAFGCSLIFSVLVMLGIHWASRLLERFKPNDSEIIGRDDASGRVITRSELLKDLNADYKRFSGNSHDRRVQRRAYGRQEKTPLS